MVHDLVSHRRCATSALVCPHLGVCLWLWLGVAVGLGQRQGKDVAGVLPGKVAQSAPSPGPGHTRPGHSPHCSASCS